MDSRQAIKLGIQGSQTITEAYLADLTDADIMQRTVPGINHIAWQLGHLIASEHDMMELVRPKSMPELPAGFNEKHKKETAKSDDPKAFFSKAEYLDMMRKQRAGTLALLDTVSDAELDQPAPEPIRSFAKTVAAAFSMQGNHWTMHAGQWAVLRRKLGRPPLF